MYSLQVFSVSLGKKWILSGSVCTMYAVHMNIHRLTDSECSLFLQTITLTLSPFEILSLENDDDIHGRMIRVWPSEKVFVSSAFAHWTRMRIMNIQSEIKSLPNVQIHERDVSVCTTQWLQYWYVLAHSFVTEFWLFALLSTHIPRQTDTWTDSLSFSLSMVVSPSNLQPQFIEIAMSLNWVRI